MFDKLRKDRPLDLARQTARRLLSARGEGNAQGMAIKLIEHYEKLNAAQKTAFFEFLASEFNPDPVAVKAASDAYVADPGADNLIRLCNAVEPERQELLRRINRAPPGHRRHHQDARDAAHAIAGQSVAQGH
jgi:malonyl-CoA decarboxylase